MTRHIRKESVLALLQGDRELFERLCASGFLPREEHEFSPDHLETVRVAHALLRGRKSDLIPAMPPQPSRHEQATNLLPPNKKGGGAPTGVTNTGKSRLET